MTFATEPGSLRGELEHAYLRLHDRTVADGLWARRLDLWSADPAIQETVANRLGWLDAVAAIEGHLPRLRACAASVRQSGITDIVLLGMGGSSLAPEVLRAVIGVSPGFPRFIVLDSVDPDAVRAAMARPATSLFVIASKSGSTIEPNVLTAEAVRRLKVAGVTEPGSHLMAITDPDTALHRRAVDERFTDTFLNPPDVGGRFSALSFFGLVPAALMGIDVDAFVGPARTMTEACRIADPRQNPGLSLGAFMAAAAQAGRDKLTLSVPPRLEPFGLWVEQLVAESTGKHGKGVVPITGESGPPSLGDDRAIVRIELGDEPYASETMDEARAAGVPVMTLGMRDVRGLGAEFFRWEVATAAAGVLLDINPFDEPNVQQAKTATRALLEVYATTRRLPLPEPDAVVDGVRLTLSEAARQQLSDSARSEVAAGGPLTFLGLLRPGDYFSLLAYLPADAETFHSLLQEFRTSVAARTGCATMLGYGPRYLHSTGQLHKGGPNTGVFTIVTADAAEDLAVPGEPYSFGILERAQAAGDFDSLTRAGRRVLLVHLPSRERLPLRRLFSALIGR